MQTVAVLARAEALEMAAGAVLVVSERAGREDAISDEALERAARVAGAAAAAVL
jgi:hypothetical protein